LLIAFILSAVWLRNSKVGVPFSVPSSSIAAAGISRQLQSTDRFEAAKSIAADAIDLIYQRYEFQNSFRFQFFLASNNIPLYGWEILKYKFAKKALSG
jgi:hypothetical protein